MMTTGYPRLPLLIAYLVDFVRKSFGLGPKPAVNLCEAFHTIFWGLFPVPSALAARLLRFAFGHGREEAILHVLEGKKAENTFKVLFLSIVAGYLIFGVYAVYQLILKYGWWKLLIFVLKVVGVMTGVLTLIIGGVIGAYLLAKYRKNRKAGSRESVSPARETFQTAAVVWHFIVAVKRHICPIYSNPLYRESAQD